jgi:hypothetical protein
MLDVVRETSGDVPLRRREGEAVSENLYVVGGRDIIGQRQHYTDHVWHMTSEGLHGKSDIAAELAHRDIEIERLSAACSEQNDEIGQIAGKALGYPWFKDDQRNFPGATEENGVCVGEHVAESITLELANKYVQLKAERDELVAERVRFAQLATNLLSNESRTYAARNWWHAEILGLLHALTEVKP